MTAVNPITVSEEEPFVIGKSDLAYFFNNPCRCDCALVLLCTSGHAQVTVDLRRDLCSSIRSYSYCPVAY